MDSDNESYHSESEFYYPDEDFRHFMYQSVARAPIHSTGKPPGI